MPFTKLERALKKAQDEILKKTKQQKFANETARIVRTRTRLGFGVNSTGTRREKLKGLAPSTKKTRASLRRTGKLSKKSTVGKSNLTQTAQLLDALFGKGRRGGFDILFRQPRQRLGNERKVPTNSQVAEFVQDQGRVFMNLSNNEIKQLQQLVGDELLKAILKNLNRL